MTTTLPFGAEIDADGIWCQVLTRLRAPGRTGALFLDRDGVLVEEVHYLSRVEEMNLIPGAAACVRTANQLSIPVVVVTNQSGIGRGYYDWDAFAAVQEAMLGDLAVEGAFVNAVFACPHHKDAKPPYDQADHPARKPNPGMLREAAQRMPIDLSQSWIVGDRAGDIAACKRAGGKGAFHVKTGHGTDSDQRRTAQEYDSNDFQVRVGDSIADVTGHLESLFNLVEETRS